MLIHFTPMRHPGTLSLQRAGDVLTINGVAYDFGPLPEGGRLPRAAVACDWLASDVTRTGGQICLTLILPHGPIPWPAPPGAAVVTHPAPLILIADGSVAVPQFDAAEEGAA